MTQTSAPSRLAADHFDGRSGRAHPVVAWLAGGRLHWVDDRAPPRDVAACDAVWPERQRHGRRQVLLPDGGVLAFGDAAAFDAWAAAGGQGHGGVVRWQQSWRLTALALVLVAGLLAGLWRWGIPAAADRVAEALPSSVEAELGRRALAYADAEWFGPSRLPEREQAAVARAVAAAATVASATTGPPPAYRLLFRDGRSLGPNAVALPGGTLVVTDALVELLGDEPQAVVGVVGHELGHVRHRHVLRQAVRAAAVGVLAGAVVGDFSFLLGSLPVTLAQMDYSRDFEREADVDARDLMRGAGIDPAVMAVFFERIDHDTAGTGARLPIAFSSHPANAERIAFFKAH